jgi:hypothetical protein
MPFGVDLDVSHDISSNYIMAVFSSPIGRGFSLFRISIGELSNEEESQRTVHRT